MVARRMVARRFALPVALLSLVLTVACSDDNPRSPGAGTPGVTGVNNTSPSLEGSWVVQSTPLTSTCGSFNTMMEQTAVLTIVQAGNSFNFTMADDCGNPIPGGTGQIDPSGTVQLGTETTRTVNGTCAVRLTQDWTGVTRTSADMFSGTNVLSIQGQTGQDNCSVTLPCTVNASFNATRCPTSGCQVTCTP
jgi:hypothetical protein